MRRPVAIIEALALAALASASAEPRPVTMTLRSKRDPDLEPPPPPPPEPPRPIRREAGVRERARLRRRRLEAVRHPAFEFAREFRGGLLSWYGSRGGEDVRLHVSIDGNYVCYWTIQRGSCPDARVVASEPIDLGDDADLVVRAALVALANADAAGETR